MAVPPAVDFQYGEWWREAFEGGGADPRPSRIDPDLAVMIAMALRTNVPLAGPPASQVFDPVPQADFVQALLAGLPGLLADLETDTGNVVLTLARVWNGVVTGGAKSKARRPTGRSRASPPVIARCSSGPATSTSVPRKSTGKTFVADFSRSHKPSLLR